LPEKEATRGRKACASYTARVCECAKSKPELADECAMAPAREQALELNLDLSSKPDGLTREDNQAVKVEARKVIAGCFEDMIRLDDQACPK
jgi:hypothetical protein